ncbi:hypothetical protein MGEO_03255 [Marivita geojedonensis]|uniref:Heparan-alpha-glucosaminide N-acetyltransferase catalytic domain-containing protein n=2 Tax=Marivita geojedonensis TaxID=1123756 RepID=A0A1X4NPR8_9RHOB|nr:hypothetical protein MGEO_03255 [Marivita geojedonensis]
MAHDNRSRLHWLDVARTAALCGMIAFHFVRDMEMFEFMPPGTTLGGFWAVFARLVAGSFLLLSGVSFVLAHGDGLRLKAWAKRIAVIAGAAVLVSLVTRLVMPHAWIQFGILHAIAAASLLGVILLRAPALVTAAAASAVLGLSFVLGRSLDLPSWMVWTGLGAAVPPSLDYIPLVPWLALFLIGMALAQAVDPARLEPRWKTPPPLALTLPGQHSLLIYLVHQPILIAILAAFSWVLR